VNLRKVDAQTIAQQQRKQLRSWPRGMSTRKMKEDMAVQRLIRLAAVALLPLALVACENQQERYFRRNVNRVSQDAMAKQFGPPQRAQELTTGETVWAYESRERSECTAYILRFDQTKVLRDWKERKC